MNATRSQLKSQYDRAKKLGWIPYFQEAERLHTKNYFDTADLMGIGSRETNLDPKWTTKAGDKGNGFGLLQIDKRSFPEFTKTDAWKDARLGILKGAEVLMSKWHDMEQHAGQMVKVKSQAFKMPALSGFKAQQAVIASYNNGRWPFYAATKGYDVDKYTTGHDYSSDVIDRAKVFRELLQADGLLKVSKPVPQIAAITDQTSTTLGNSSDTQASTTSVTQEKGDTTVTISEKNEQDVSVSAGVIAPEPYMGVGFWAVIKRDLAAATGGNIGFSTLSEYAREASGWPEWIVAILQKLAVGLLIATLGYFLFRIIHYAVDTWKKYQKTKMEAEAATSTVRKDITWI